MSAIVDPSPETFQRVVGALNASFWEWTPGTGEIHVSPTMAELMEFSSDDWSVERFYDWVYPDDRDAYRAWLVGYLNSDRIRSDVTYRYIRRDGRIGWARNHNWVERDATGRVTRMTGTVADITDEKTREIELQDNAARQAASVEVLKAITASPGDIQPVFELIARRLAELCQSRSGVLEFDGSMFHLRALHGVDPELREAFVKTFPLALDTGGSRTFDRAVMERRTIHIPDVSQDPIIAATVQTRTLRGRSIVCAPMLRDGKPIGAVALNDTLDRPGGFSASQIAFLEMFAEQAVIAITSAETYRALQDRTAELAERNDAFSERIDHQAATIDVLKEMSASPGDPQPVFDLIVRQAQALCGSRNAALFEYDGTMLHYRAWVYAGGWTEAHEAYRRQFPRRMTPNPNRSVNTAILEGRIVHIRDADKEPGVAPEARASGIRAGVVVPIFRDGAAIGAITMTNHEPGGFSDTQIELLQTFAEQAAIAIGSAETYRALRDRTAELAERNDAFAERIEHQSATIDVLKAMSASPGDPQPVFDQIVRRAKELSNALEATLFRYDGELVHHSAVYGQATDPPTPESVAYVNSFPMVPTRGSLSCRAILDKRIIHVRNTETDPELSPVVRELFQTAGLKSQLSIPLLRDGTVLGAITLNAEPEGGFSASQVALLETFAEQAVIAITSAETYRALQSRTADLQESLEQQTATAEILEVINRSPGDLTPVFDMMLEKAMHLCGISYGLFNTWEGMTRHPQAVRGLSPAMVEYRTARMSTVDVAPAVRHYLRTKKTHHVPDLMADEGYQSNHPDSRAIVDIGGMRTALFVPLVKDDVVIAAFNFYRQEVRAFTDKEITLLESFAAQAMIAMENARLLGELQERTAALALRNTEFGEQIEHQAATIDVLAAMSSSPGDPGPVFELISRRAQELCDSASSALYSYDGHVMNTIGDHTSTATPFSQRQWSAIFPRPLSRGIIAARCILERRIVHVRDLGADTEIDRDLYQPLLEAGRKSVVAIPMVRDDTVIGAISINSNNAGGLSDSQVALLQTFAEQAVIAITSAETYRALQTRTADLQESLEQQTATAEILEVINRSPGDLAPVFDMMLEKAMHLCGISYGIFNTWEGMTRRTQAVRGLPQAMREYRMARPQTDEISPAARHYLRTRKTHHIPDLMEYEGYRNNHPDTRALVDLGGMRTALFVPLVKDNVVIATFNFYRQEVREFADKDITLLESFAAQAMIAIENARLLGELQERTAALAERNSEFGERIDQQAATIDVLKVMSSTPDDTQPIFDQIVRRARELCSSSGCRLMEFDGSLVHLRASYVDDSPSSQAFEGLFPMPPTRGTVACRAILENRIIHIRDLDTDPDVMPVVRGTPRKSQLAVPLLRDGVAIGAIVIGSDQSGGYTDSQIALLETFAEQAVIAIGSTATYRALQERTKALAQRNSEFGERIEQQSATIDVLKVMSRTPDDTQPIFDQIVRRARDLCNSNTAFLLEYDGSLVHFRAMDANIEIQTPAYASYLAQFPMVPTRGSIPCRAILEGRVIHIADVRNDLDLSPAVRALMSEVTYRSQIVIPLMRDGRAIGCISMTAVTPGGFSELPDRPLGNLRRTGRHRDRQRRHLPRVARTHRRTHPIRGRTSGVGGSAALGQFLARSRNGPVHHHQPRGDAVAGR